MAVLLLWLAPRVVRTAAQVPAVVLLGCGAIYALRGVTRIVDIVQPLIRFVGPYVTVCNYFNYSFTHLGEHITEPDTTGSAR